MNLLSIIQENVRCALLEDIGEGDITASLIPATTQAVAHIISREAAIVCGIAWVNEVFAQVDPVISLKWQVQDGDVIQSEQLICILQGPARSLLTAERCALNFLQTLSGTATTTHHYVKQLQQLENNKIKLLDTRKTLPGMRAAQKYAVKCGGGLNHRMGLFDAFLIKENHIMACGSITAAVKQARELHPNKPIEVEVETLAELEEALAAQVDRVMLDNFDLTTVQQAVTMNNGQAELEISGNISQENLAAVAAMGVDYISVGALTKHVRAIDFSMRFES